MGESPRADQAWLWESSSWCGRLTERSAGVRGLWPAARLCPSRAFPMRAPVSRPHPFDALASPQPGGVGELGLAPSAYRSSHPTVRYAKA